MRPATPTPYECYVCHRDFAESKIRDGLCDKCGRGEAEAAASAWEKSAKKCDAEATELKARIAAVVAIHPRRQNKGGDFSENERPDWCHECDVRWPCPTLRAAEGK